MPSIIKNAKLFVGKKYIGKIEQLEEKNASVDNTIDFSNTEKMQCGSEVRFGVNVKNFEINKFLVPCFGEKPYVDLDRCSKCKMKKDCVIAKIKRNFNGNIKIKK